MAIYRWILHSHMQMVQNSHTVTRRHLYKQHQQQQVLSIATDKLGLTHINNNILNSHHIKNELNPYKQHRPPKNLTI